MYMMTRKQQYPSNSHFTHISLTRVQTGDFIKRQHSLDSCATWHLSSVQFSSYKTFYPVVLTPFICRFFGRQTFVRKLHLFVQHFFIILSFIIRKTITHTPEMIMFVPIMMEDKTGPLKVECVADVFRMVNYLAGIWRMCVTSENK